MALLAGCLSWSNGDAPRAQAQTQGAVQAGAQSADSGGELTSVLSLRIRHDYFADGRCSVCRVVPSHETTAILDRADAVFFSQASEGRVAARSADALEAVDHLTFEVWVTDSDFPRYTDPDDPVLSSEITGFRLPNSQARTPQAIVEVSLGAAGTVPVEATIAYSSRAVLWRWIIVPSRQSDSFADWSVRRKTAPDTPVDQDPPEEIVVAGRPAWRITLRDPLPFRQRVPESKLFVLVPPQGDTVSESVSLPSAGSANFSKPSSQDEPDHAEMFVFL